MNIGSVFMELLAQSGTLGPSVMKEAQAAGTAGAATLNKSMTSSLRTAGVKAFGLAATAAFGIATKGALELENVTADIQAQTGLSADEARHAASVVNKAAGENRLSLTEVSDAAIKVHNDLGLVGDAADEMTNKFAVFARVTHQQAGAAVSSFDDILDAWNLTAEDATGIMDKLIVSQQRYGGSISETQNSIGKFAPQLRALGVDMDGAIGLFNLANAVGLDTGRMMGALNTAVRKLKPGQTLDDLIKQIASIEDPTVRAQEAIKVFGARGGVALANALKPGINGLSDFEISTADATGATQKAADIIDSTWSGRIAKAFSIAGASLREFGAGFGPALTSIASISSLLATSGLFKGVGAKIGGGIAKGMAGSAAYGKAIAHAIELLPGVGAVKSAILSAGTKIGTALGVSASAAFALAAVAAVAAVAFVAQQQQAGIDAMGETLKGKAEEFAKIAKDQDLAKAIAGTREQLDKLPGNAYDSRNKVIAVLNTLIAEQNRRGAEGTTAFAEGAASAEPEVEKAAKFAITDPTLKAAYDANKIAAKGGEQTPAAYAAGVRARREVVGDAFSQLLDDMKNLMGRGETIARDIGILTGKKLQEGLHDRRAAVRAEARGVQAQAEQELAILIQRGGKVGKDAGEELKKGLNSKNPEIRASAQRVKDIVSGKFDEIPPKAKDAGTATGQAFLDGLRPKLQAALTTIANTLSKAFSSLGSPTPTPPSKHRADRNDIGGAIRAGRPSWVNENTARSELIVPQVSGHIVTHADAVRAIQEAAGMGSGGVTVNMPVSGALPVRTISDISGEMQRIDDSGILPDRQIAPKYHRRETAGAGARL